MKRLFTLSQEALFRCLALLFGVAFALLVPPFQSPDEPNHFLRAYQVSEGVFFPEKQNQRLGGTLPVSLAQVRDSFSFLKMNYAARMEANQIFRDLKITLRAEQRSFLDFPNTAIYAPTAYLPQATAILLLRPCGATPLQMVYAARLANLLVWVWLVSAAIGRMPFLKNTLVVLALLPASLAVAASANADVVTNGLCWWLVAWLLHGAAHSKRAFLQLVRPLASMVVVCANKLIVLPIVLAYWLRSCGKRVGVHKLGTSEPLLFSLFTTVGLAAALTWSNLAQQWFIPYDNYNSLYRDAQTLNEGVDPAQQKAFVIENPLYFIEITTTSIAKSLPSMAAHFVGKFGWEKNYLHPLWLSLLWLILAAICTIEINPLTRYARLLALAAVALYIVMFALTMYVLWYPVGAGAVTNFQGRYFVPIAPLAALALAGDGLYRWRLQIWQASVAVLIASNLAMAQHIWERFY